jgi:hypothetical protein
MHGRTKDLPAQKKEENEQQHRIRADSVRPDHKAEVDDQAEYEPNQHENPKDQAESHGFIS